MENTYFKKIGSFQGISSFTLKLIAILTMLIDHSAAVFLGSAISVPRLIGRIAFPIFAFMIAEGAARTHSVKKYALRLFVFALISEIPFDLALMGTSFSQPIELSHQNVFFTLTLGLLAIAARQRLYKTEQRLLCIPVLLLCMASALILKTDYADSGVLCIYLFYVFSQKENRIRIPGFILAAAVPSLSIINLSVYKPELFALFGLIPIFLYNGERGAKINRYVFYAFYPAHLMLLFLLHLILR